MSYFYKNKVYNYYQVTDQSTGSASIVKDVIEIINNEKILFDFSNLIVHATSVGVLNFSDVETIKIRIDWGDGNIDRLSKPLISNKSSIGVYRPNQWKVIEHLFNVQKRYEYKTNDADSLHKIVITAYNSFNDKLTITIPYKMVYKTLYDLGSEMSLFSSNTTNNNRVSYTLKQMSTDSMFVVMSKHWRSIYGEDDVEIIEEKKVSKDFSDEFVNVDTMVWDWKSIPTINLTVDYKLPSSSNNNKGVISGSFYETGVAIDKWEPYIVYPQDTGDIKPVVVKSDTEEFKFNSTSTLNPGIYAISINPILGINGVRGSSDVKYINFNSATRPRELREPANKSVINVSNTNKQIEVNYTLKNNQQLKNLTKAELRLIAHFKDVAKQDVSIDDIRFSYDLLKPLLDSKGNPLYVKTESKSKDFQYVIPMRNIPNQQYYKKDDGTDTLPVLSDIEYDVEIITNDVLGGQDNTIFYTNEGNIKTLPKVSFSYDIGNFGSGTKLNAQNQIDKSLTLDWKFTTSDEWDEFKVQYKNTKLNETIYDDTHEYAGDNRFNGLNTTVSNNVITNFQKIFDGNVIPDGDYLITITYNVHMGDYYETRTKEKKITGTFTYKKPVLTIDDIRPYTKIHYDALRDSQSLSLCSEIVSSYNAEPLKNISLTIDGNNDEVYDLSKINYIYDFDDVSQQKKTFKIEAANLNDIYNRLGSVTKQFAIKSEISSLLQLPSNGVDYLPTDFTKVFEVVEEQDKVVDMLWVKQNTLHDVVKTHKYTVDGVEYFGCGDRGKFVYGDTLNADLSNGQTRYALYKIITLKNGSKTYRRFMPYTGSTNGFGSGSALSSAKSLITSNYSTDYQSIVDKGKILIDWSSSNSNIFNNTDKIKNLWFQLYDKDNKLIVQDEVIGLKDKTIENLDFGTYKYRFELQSEYNATNSHLTDLQTIQLKVPANKSVIHTLTQPIISEAENGKKYVLWRWKVNHKLATEIIFCYTTNTGKTGQFVHAKFQEEYEPEPFDEGEEITYWFKVKSPYINGTPDDDGYVNVNKKIFTLPKTESSTT